MGAIWHAAARSMPAVGISLCSRPNRDTLRPGLSVLTVSLIPTPTPANMPGPAKTGTPIGTPSGTPTGTGERLLEYLRAHGPTSAPGLSRGMGGPTPKVITKHLRRLQLEGLVDQSGPRWQLSFAGLSTMPAGPEDEAAITAAVTAEMEWAAKIAQAQKLVTDSLALLGRQGMDDLPTRGLRRQLEVATRKLADATPRSFDPVCEAIAPVIKAVQERRASRGEAPTTGRGQPSTVSGPLRDLIDRRGHPRNIFLRGGWVTELPLVEGMRFRAPLGRRYASTVAGCGVVIWDKSAWRDPEVEALRRAAIAAASDSPPALTMGTGSK
jgi:DNA-binding HxlR family transcriptional regulator